MKPQHIVLAAQAAAAPTGGAGPYYSVSTRTLAAYLEDRLPAGRTRVTVYDWTVDTPVSAVLDDLERLAPDVLGLSCYLWNYQAHYAVCEVLKKSLPRTRLVLGGPQVSYDADDLGALFARLPGVDLVVQDEGERVLLEYVRTPDAERPPPGTVVRGAARSSLAMGKRPLYERFPAPEVPPVLMLETARGCPCRCAFCTYGERPDRRRSRPIAELEAEYAWAAGAGVDSIVYAEPEANRDEAMLEGLVEAAERTGVARSYLHCLDVNYRYLTRRHVALLARLQVRVGIGLQSSNPVALRAVRQSFQPRAFAQTMQWMEEFGLEAGVHVLLGLPGDTLAAFSDTADFALASKQNVGFAVLRILPGTELYRRRRELGLVYDEARGHLLRRSADWSEAALAEACDLVRQKAARVRALDYPAAISLWTDVSETLVTHPSARPVAVPANRAEVERLLGRARALFGRFEGVRLVREAVATVRGRTVVWCKLQLESSTVLTVGVTGPDSVLPELAHGADFQLVPHPPRKRPPTDDEWRLLSLLRSPRSARRRRPRTTR